MSYIGETVHLSGRGGCVPAVVTGIGSYQTLNLCIMDAFAENVYFDAGIERDDDLERGTWHQIGAGDCDSEVD